MLKRFVADTPANLVKRLKTPLLVGVLASGLLAPATQLVAAAASEGQDKTKASPSQSKAGARPVTKGLHRLDFVLTHASCPSCILKVRAALRATPGVVKCEIALRKPYGGAVIFSPAQVTLDRMRDVASKADPNKIVELSDVIEKPVDSVPELLVPTYMFKHE
jgi:copper chaperone CopZ